MKWGRLVGIVLVLSSTQASATDVEIKATVALPAGSTPAGLAIDSSTNLVYVALSGANEVGIYDEDLGAQGTLAVGSGVFRLAVDPRPASHHLYIGLFPGLIQIIDLDTLTLMCSVGGMGGGISGLTLDPVANRVLVSVESAPAVAVLDATAPCSVQSYFPVGTKPLGLDVDPLTGLTYLAIHHEDQVEVLDPDTAANTELSVLTGDPTDVSVDPIGGLAYVAYSLGNSITVLDLGPGGLGPITQSHVTVGDGPRRVAADPGRDRAFSTVLNFGQIAVVENGVLVDVVSTGHPDDVEVNANNHCAYVSVRSPDRLTKICDVLSPEEEAQEAVQELQVAMIAADLPKGATTALVVKLEAAEDALAEGDVEGAIDILKAALNFISAQSGKKIPVELAEAWSNEIKAIIDLLE